MGAKVVKHIITKEKIEFHVMKEFYGDNVSLHLYLDELHDRAKNKYRLKVIRKTKKCLSYFVNNEKIIMFVRDDRQTPKQDKLAKQYQDYLNKRTYELK